MIHKIKNDTKYKSKMIRSEKEKSGFLRIHAENSSFLNKYIKIK